MKLSKTEKPKLEERKSLHSWVIGLFVFLLIYVFILIPLDNFFDHSFPTPQKIQKIWSNWFPNVEKVKNDCLLDEQKNPVVSIFGYKQCLIENNIEINNSDIRKVCYLQARDVYLVNNKSKTENQYYLDCVRSQGLPD